MNCHSCLTKRSLSRSSFTRFCTSSIAFILYGSLGVSKKSRRQTDISSRNLRDSRRRDQLGDRTHKSAMTSLKAVSVRALCLLKRGLPKRIFSGTSLFISPTVPCPRVLYPVVKLTNVGLLHTGSVRWKYNKKTTSSVDEEDSDSDEETANFKDDRDSKVIKSSVNSLRLDLILKSGLGLARNKVEVIFYENKIRVNGEKITKKSILIDVGDEIDVVKGLSPANPSHILVGRVQVLSLSEQEGSYKVTMRRFKSLVIENYSGQNMWKSASAS